MLVPGGDTMKIPDVFTYGSEQSVNKIQGECVQFMDIIMILA